MGWGGDGCHQPSVLIPDALGPGLSLGVRPRESPASTLGIQWWLLLLGFGVTTSHPPAAPPFTSGCSDLLAACAAARGLLREVLPALCHGSNGQLKAWLSRWDGQSPSGHRGPDGQGCAQCRGLVAPSSAPGAWAKDTQWRLQEPLGKKWEGGECGEQ